MKEAQYQALLIKRIQAIFPGCLVEKNDAVVTPGVPDLRISWRGRYGYLEVKASATASLRPNQQYYVDKYREEHGFAEFIFPENEVEVLRALQQSLEHGR